MKKVCKWVLVFCVFLTVLTMLSLNAAAETTWNTWENLEWQYDADTKTLYVRGEGAIPEIPNEYPWEEYRYSYVENLVIGEGITDIPQYPFICFYALKTIEFPSTLKNLDTLFLEMCALEKITVQEGGVYYAIDDVLFSNKDGCCTLWTYPHAKEDKEYTVPEGVQCLSRSSITNTYLQELYLPESLERIENAAISTSVKELHIPASVTFIDDEGINWTSTFESITVDEENLYYCSIDGVLYTKDVATLHTYPIHSSITVFYVPDTVVEMANDVFYATNLIKLYMPSSVECINYQHGMLYNKEAQLKEISVAEDNSKFCSVDGILYSKDMTVLYNYPGQKEDTVYHIPDTVTLLKSGCFKNALKIEELYMGAGVRTLEEHRIISDDSALKSVYLPGNFPSYFEQAFINLSLSGTFSFYNGTDVTFYYPSGASGWTSPTMEINGGIYKTSPYTPTTTGDVNGDGVVDTADLALLQKYFYGYPVVIDFTQDLDFNHDGSFTRADVMYLARALAKWDGYTLQ